MGIEFKMPEYMSFEEWESWGKNQNEKEKTYFTTLPLDAVMKCAELLTKYDLEKGDKWKNYSIDYHFSALMRHWYEYKKGNKIDKEHGMNHLVSVACRALFMLAKELEVKDEKR